MGGVYITGSDQTTLSTGTLPAVLPSSAVSQPLPIDATPFDDTPQTICTIRNAFTVAGSPPWAQALKGTGCGFTLTLSIDPLSGGLTSILPHRSGLV